MHCISDSCATNCSRCSSHWLGALSAHTVRISSIIAHRPQAEPHRPIIRRLWHFELAAATLRLDRCCGTDANLASNRPPASWRRVICWVRALGKTREVSHNCYEFA